MHVTTEMFSPTHGRERRTPGKIADTHPELCRRIRVRQCEQIV